MGDGRSRPPLHQVTRRLLWTRGLRSIGQGALVVAFVLYLKDLHWTAASIGLLLMVGTIAGAALSLAVGPISDRYGRRRFLLIYQAALVVGTAALMADRAGWVLVVTSALLGYGRGLNGAAGPFAPAEQAWLAQAVPRAERARIFSLNGAVGFWGMGVGSLIAAAVPLWRQWLPGASAYEPLFALTALIGLLNYVQISGLREQAAAPLPPAVDAAADAPAADALQRRENVALAALFGINAVNALGVGLFAPLLPYWLAVRFGVGAGSIGSVFGVSLLLTGAASIANGMAAERYGLVRTVVWMRLAGVALLALLPLAPTYGWAATLYFVRSLLNRGALGAQQAFSVGLVRDRRRGLASSLNAASFGLPSAIGPAIAGQMIDAGALDLPFFLAAALQLTYAVLFGTVLASLVPRGVDADEADLP